MQLTRNQKTLRPTGLRSIRIDKGVSSCCIRPPPFNDDNHKKVDLYCPHDWKAISCEAAIGADDGYQDASERSIALNEIFPRQFGSDHDERWGCRGRANNIFGYLGHEYRFDWELKVFATCVPDHCVDRYEAHHGEFHTETK